jgi:hypothetical protein
VTRSKKAPGEKNRTVACPLETAKLVAFETGVNSTDLADARFSKTIVPCTKKPPLGGSAVAA